MTLKFSVYTENCFNGRCKQTAYIARNNEFSHNLPTDAFIELPTARCAIISTFIFIFEQKKTECEYAKIYVGSVVFTIILRET